ncbi:MAG: SIS domain-containing protein, partial [Anaerolineae bacterium]|nr:SIS domain-containing protein [Anaerolineae bacterium]
SSNETILALGRQAFQIEENALRSAFDALDDAAFLRAVEVLASAGRIAASGCGHTGIACQHFTHLMCCVERPARFLSPSDATHGGSGFLQPGDVLLLASRGGQTAELLPLLEIARQKSVCVITVTENVGSALAKGADIVLAITVTHETDRFNSQGTTSFTVLSVLFDALQAALIERIDFQSEQFRMIHPGGAVGRRLNK